MGKIICIEPQFIRPSQNFLKEDTVRFILKQVFTGQHERLPPIPIVRYYSVTNQYIAIDGHNLLAVKDLLGEACSVYVPNSAQDEITVVEAPNSSEFAIRCRNKDLAEKFYSVLELKDKVEQQGIRSFQDLRMQYYALHSIKTVQLFYSDLALASQ